MIAALFVAADGPYIGRPDVDPWTEDRDARTYTGELPVVAHPPCQLWTNFARLNYSRWGGEHNRPGNDGGMFASALANVRRCGGVLEHPAFSYAFAEHGIPSPALHGWNQTGPCEWVAEVWQSAYGHKARKRTWLFYVGDQPEDADWTREPGTHQVGWFDRKRPTLGKREALLTPPLFAEYLIRLACR